jgi:peptidoglycan/xylan/chitin deacetylase (PgdA/CDA1 family)
VSRSAHLARGLELTGLGAFLRRRHWSGVVAFNYHRIGTGEGSPYDRAVWTTNADAFDAQVRFAARHFDLIGPEDLAAAARERRGRHAMITFDDGYRDNYEVALPILASHGAHATFFVTTGFIDERRISWWDEISWMARMASRPETIDVLNKRYKSLPGDEAEHYLDCLAESSGIGRHGSADEMWMTWDMLRDIRDAGMSIGAHTVTHPVLANQSRERQIWEVGTSKRRLEEELGGPVAAFSYPEGTPSAFDAVTRGALATHGFRLAFSFYGGYRSFADWDPYDVRRTTVSPATPHALFRQMLTVPKLFVRSAPYADPAREARAPVAVLRDDPDDAGERSPAAESSP